MEAKGRAEAEQMAKKAEAFQQYKDGAMVDMLLEKLPLVRLFFFFSLVLNPWFPVTFPVVPQLRWQKRSANLCVKPRR